jgi:hypothetical protein
VCSRRWSRPAGPCAPPQPSRRGRGFEVRGLRGRTCHGPRGERPAPRASAAGVQCACLTGSSDKHPWADTQEHGFPFVAGTGPATARREAGRACRAEAARGEPTSDVGLSRIRRGPRQAVLGWAAPRKVGLGCAAQARRARSGGCGSAPRRRGAPEAVGVDRRRAGAARPKRWAWIGAQCWLGRAARYWPGRAARCWLGRAAQARRA